MYNLECIYLHSTEKRKVVSSSFYSYIFKTADSRNMFDILSTEMGRNESQRHNPGIGFRSEIHSKSEVTSDLPRWIPSLYGMA